MAAHGAVGGARLPRRARGEGAGSPPPSGGRGSCCQPGHAHRCHGDAWLAAPLSFGGVTVSPPAVTAGRRRGAWSRLGRKLPGRGRAAGAWVAGWGSWRVGTRRSGVGAGRVCRGLPGPPAHAPLPAHLSRPGNLGTAAHGPRTRHRRPTQEASSRGWRRLRSRVCSVPASGSETRMVSWTFGTASGALCPGRGGLGAGHNNWRRWLQMGFHVAWGTGGGPDPKG